MSNIYIEVGKDNIITKVHYSPFDPKVGLQTPKDELDKTGFFINEMPDPERIIGKRAIPKFNADRKTVYYDYENVPLSDTERINNLEAALNDIIMKGL